MKKKKLYYLPGIISIIGLPVLLFIWGPPDPVRQKCMTLYLAASDSLNSSGKFTSNSLPATMINKKIISLNLNDFIWNEQSEYLHYKKFNFIQREIEKLEFTNDTTAVLKIGFGTQNSYRSFAWVLNQAMIYNLHKYVIADNNIYLFPNPPSRQQYASVALQADNYFIKMPHQAKWQNFYLAAQLKWRDMQQQVNWFFYKQKQNKLLAVGFILLIAIPAFIKARHLFQQRSTSYSLN